eukprot:scaffold82298_cov45-Cyclotella_meneghiniana.AAC.17
MRVGNTQQRRSLRDGVRIKVAAAYSVPNGNDDRPWNNIIPHASIKMIGGLSADSRQLNQLDGGGT